MKVVAVIVIVLFSLFVVVSINNNIKNYIQANNVIYRNSPHKVPSDKLGSIFWIVQVSDIHVSRYTGHERAPDLQRFCDTHLPIIKPKVVIASGDLTDAKFRNLRGSKQFVDEWQIYHKAVHHCQKHVKTWLDLRGNHDAFDTPDLNHRYNLFREYSAQGRDHASSYLYHHTEPFGRYSLLAVDASPNPGPKRPFNFFGYITSDGETMVKHYLNESLSSNLTIAFGHYPTSLIATQTGLGVRNLLRNATAYLCGHLHTLAGLVPRMYARHKTGMLELELGDWKDERIYRVLAVDHDMLSVVDAKMGKWPVVMVTNPKEASLMAPLHEPLFRMKQSTHIRILVFSDGEINNVEVYIDGIHQGKARNSEGPLYVLPWQPSQLSDGVHSLRVVVQDTINGRDVTEQLFSLDGTTPLLPFRGRFILMLDIATIAKGVYFFMVSVYLLVLVLLSRTNNIKPHLFALKGSVLRPVLLFYNTWIQRMWFVAKTSSIFYSLIGAILYVTFGPWLVGEILEGYTGVVFIWGLYVNGSYLPVCLTYFYGLFQVLTFNIPLTMYLGYLLQYLHLGNTKKSICHTARHVYFPFVALLVFQSYIALSEFPAAYGTRAFLLGPVRTGSVILAVIMYFIARKTNIHSLVTSHNN